jgi:ribosomal protein L29
MKVTKERDELKNMRIEDLAKSLHEARRDLFALRLNTRASHVKDYSLFKKLRRRIARTLTILRYKIQQAHETIEV